MITNQETLQKAMEKLASKSLTKVRDTVYNCIDNAIKNYYKEYTPSVYNRKYKFLNSLIKTDVKVNGNIVSCRVEIDKKYLSYNYPYTEKFALSYPHHADGRFASGIDIAHWANNEFPDDDYEGGNHGYTVSVINEDEDNKGFWDGSLDELGSVIELIEKNLKNNGIKII